MTPEEKQRAYEDEQERLRARDNHFFQSCLVELVIALALWAWLMWGR